MTRLLVVDGGQSAVRVRMSTSMNNPSTVVELPGVTRLDEPITTIPLSVADAIEHLQHPRIDRVVLGLTTAPTDPDDLNRLARSLAHVTGARQIWLADDTVTAHAAAFAGETGVVLWVGTGVACFAVSASGMRAFDGLGFLLGDLGGAYAIGREALAGVLRDHDLGRPCRTKLTALAESRFGNLHEAPIALHDSPNRIYDIAQFARDVLSSAASDEYAAEILNHAAEELAMTTRAAAGWIGPHSPVVLGGGLLSEQHTLRQALIGRLEADPQVGTISSASKPAIDGAEWLGHQDSPGIYQASVFTWNQGEET